MHIDDTRLSIADYLNQWADGLISRAEFLSTDNGM